MSFKNMLSFVAGGLTFAWLYSKGLEDRTTYPREGSTVYEDDRIKVIKMSKKKGSEYDIATITYKEQTVEETEEA